MKTIVNTPILWGKLTASLVILAVLGGCAISQEGAVDYRKADLISPAQRKAAREKSLASPNSDAIVPMQLVSKSIQGDGGALIESGSSITIRLSQAFIAHFWEIGLFSPHRGFRSNGEIAIVVNAFEFSPEDTSRDFNFTPEGLKKGRLVFFSNDVEEGQFLNLSNMPIYGPITYNGNPLGIAITILEIDADSEQLSALLGTLASAGAAVYPPAAPVLPLLDSLGQALMSSGTDDTEFRFTFVLDPKNSYDGLSYPRVEAGNYVFIRENNRQATTPWETLLVDENSGRVYYRDNTAPGPDTEQGENAGKGLYRENTYLTIQINKGFDSTGIDLAQDSFITFRETLDEIDKQRAAEIRPVLEAVTAVALGRIQKRNFLSARNLFNGYKAACEQKDTKEVEARRAGFDLYVMLDDAIKKLTSNKGSGKGVDKPKLSKQDVEFLLGRLRVKSDAGTEAELRKFTMAGFASGFTDFEDFFETTCK